ncbi:MAG: FG-GAP-like repeat-containing protein [Planctomycetota bacterium]|nr:FG-GAP-like repeat-containing protein [Planctomycetota bacterium]
MSKHYTAITVTLIFSSIALGQERRFVSGSRLQLGVESDLSASVRVADFDGNKTSDIVVANGRHWPGQNYLFMNQGRAIFSIQRQLGSDRCTTYATEPADLDGDGDLDIAVGNDMAPNRVFFNDGNGNFIAGPVFGEPSSVRSLETADIDGDGDIDILSTCRRRENQIYLNDGQGNFVSSRPFGTEQDSTIDVAVADWNSDGHFDLILANRDDQQNAILINDGHLNFDKAIPFGSNRDQTRSVAVTDLNGDSLPDIVVANIGQTNHVYLADGKGGFEIVPFGLETGRSYALTLQDMDNDQDIDLVVGNVGEQNAVFMNLGDGRGYNEVRFGDPSTATYGLDTGDVDGDGFQDIVVANSGSQNLVFLNRRGSPPGVARPSMQDGPPTAKHQPPGISVPNENATPVNPTTQPDAIASTKWPDTVASVTQADTVGSTTKSDGRVEEGMADWDSFRGRGGKGVADGSPVRTAWNADETAGELSGVLWSTQVPGLGHSSPVISGDRIFLATAIAAAGDAPLSVGRGGKPDAADDQGEQSWVVLCYDRNTGEEIWRQTAQHGIPKATRHAKATHANTSIAIEGDNVVAFFGSEGIHCFDKQGNKKWSRDLGLINISKYGIGWGFASSPAIEDGRIAIVCDDPDNPFVAALQLSDGKEIWRTSRQGICERSWGTPFIHSSPDKDQVVINGWPWVVSYDFATGEPIWKIRGGGDNPVPTPFEANGWIYITSAHGAESPIFVVRPDANGDISPPEETGTNDSVVWSTRRGGSYMSTPVVYGEYLYLGNPTGVNRWFHANTGELISEKRLGTGASIISSLVAADNKVFCPSENGTVYVLKAGPEFEIIAENEMGNPCFASPAIAGGVLYMRTTKHLVAIK